MSRVAIVGSGFIGRAWAISYARVGHEVALWDEFPEVPGKALDFIRSALPDLVANDLLGGSTPEALVARIRIEPTLEGALEGATHVQESAPEKVEVKRALYTTLDRLAPADAVLASSTSAILPSLFTEHLSGRARCLVVHPINPPYLVPAVEVVPAPWTSPDVVERTRAFMVAAGHAPIVMKRELAGFVMNRMQAALLHEAFRLVEGGYASVEDVDIGIREGLALRWSFMGPFETIDLNAPAGVRDYLTRYGAMLIGLAREMREPAALGDEVLMDKVEAERRAKLPAEGLPARGLWRDKRLMALAAHKRKAAKEVGE